MTNENTVAQFPATAQIWSLAGALLAVSAAVLIFEVTLTRLFSVIFHYHYVFLAVSLAVLGLGLGALLGQILQSRLATDRGVKSLSVIPLALSLSFPLFAFLLVRLPSVRSVLLPAGMALVPFVLAGLFAALAFARFAPYSDLLYGADLLGAALGLLVALGLLALWGAFNVIIFLGAVAAVAALALTLVSGDLRTGMGALVCLTLAVTTLGLNLPLRFIDLAPAELAGAPRDKTMIHLLRDPDQKARIVYTAWDPFARVDVVETDDSAVKLVFTDGGAGSFMYRFDGDLSGVSHLRHTLEYLPFRSGGANRVLVLGAGAGKDILLALLAGSEAITAVEVNPAMVDATRRFADYNGGVLDRPGVQLIVGDARTFVERSSERYDLIYLNLVYTQAAEPGSQALVEGYIFTTQAFHAYLQRLKPGGRVAIISHQALEGSRAMITALQSLLEEGLTPPQALKHLALLMVPARDPTQRATVMILQKEPLTEAEIRGLAEGAARLGLRPLFLPGVYEAPFAPLLEGETLPQYLTGDPTYDLSPTGDDKPFFFKLDPGLPAPVREALLTALALAGLIVGLAVWRGARRRRSGGGGNLAGFVAYLALIGLGFMLVEVALIQRFQLLLGQPVLSLALVLGVLLLGGGLGSLMSGRVRPEGLATVISWVALAVGGLVLLYLFILPAVIRLIMPAPLLVRSLTIVTLVLPLGFVMGMPFPSGLRLAQRDHAGEIPLLWGVNGVFSVLGSVLAVVIAMGWGFSRALALGAACYLGLFVLTAWMARMDWRG